MYAEIYEKICRLNLLIAENRALYRPICPMPSPFSESLYTILVEHIWENDTANDRPASILVSVLRADNMLDVGELVSSHTLTAEDNWKQSVTVSQPGYYYAVAAVPGYTTVESPRIIVSGEPNSQYDGLIWEAPNENNPFGSANYFSALVFGDMTVEGADVESGLAVGGSFVSAAGFSVGMPWDYINGHAFVGYPIAPHNPRFLLRGDLSVMQNMDVFGGTIVLSQNSTYPSNANITSWKYMGENAFYNESDRADFVPTSLPYSITRATEQKIDAFFSEAQSSLQSLSQGLSNLQTSVSIYTVTVPDTAWVGEGYKDLYLNTVLPADFDYSLYETIVFNVTAPVTSTVPETAAAVSTWASTILSFPADFAGWYIINVRPATGVTTLNIVSGATIINGESALLDKHGQVTVWELARRYSDRIILNFPDSSLSTITTSGNELIGSVLAPYSDFRPEGGAVNGTLVARSVSAGGGWEVHSTTHFGRIRPAVDYDGVLQLISTRIDNSAAEVTFTAQKSADGAALPEGRFFFGVFRDDVLLAVASNDAAGTITFPPMRFEEAGTYPYIIRELSRPGGGWIVDGRDYSAVVNVMDNGAGQLTASIYYPDGAPSFTNISTILTSDPILAFKISNGWSQNEVTFEFGLFDESGALVATAGNINGVVEFADVTYTQTGTYNYTIRELTPSGNGWIMDGSMIPVTVQVTSSNEDQFIAFVSYPNGQPVFVNRFESVSVTARLTATKLTVGKQPKPGLFVFSLFDENGTLVSSATNDADGLITFPDLVFDEPGTYRYIIREIAAAGTNWTMDNNEFIAVVTVVNDGQGQLVPLVTYPGGEPIFINRSTCDCLPQCCCPPPQCCCPPPQCCCPPPQCCCPPPQCCCPPPQCCCPPPQCCCPPPQC